ncbi:MAG TPA: glycosyltransferase family 39 protein [Anaerolineae bacterium]|nr:glycosyltransferase family 39 protein [Anaerolineae bacterium]
MALYAAVFAAGLFLRLFRLEIAPLSMSEATQALAALSGTALPAGGSPLLTAINSLLMSLFSPGDTIARFLPAIAGSLLVLSPALFRDALGRLGALGASVILAISPTAVVASRSLDGEVVAVACALAVVAMIRRYLARRDDRSLLVAAAALGIGLASGLGMVTALLAMGTGLLLLRPALGPERGAEWREGWRAIAGSPQRMTILLVFAMAYVLSATGGLTRPSGLAAAGDLVAAWFGAFAASGGMPVAGILQILIVYEPLAMLIGVAGLGRVLVRRGQREAPVIDPETGQRTEQPPFDELALEEPGARFGVWLGFTVIATLAIVLIQASRQPIDLLLPVTLLALLGAYAIQAWAEMMIAEASPGVESVLLAVGAAAAAFLMLTLTTFVRRQVMPTLFAGAGSLAQFGLIGLFLLVLGAGAGLMTLLYGGRAVLRAGSTLALGLLALASLSAAWGATQVRAGDAREIIWGPEVTTPGVFLLLDTADQLAIRSQGHLESLPIRVETDDPVVLWYLRDARVLPDQAPAGMVTLYGEQPQSVTGSYIGARFNIRESWDVTGLNPDAWLKWALYRESDDNRPVPTQSLTLWQRQ